MRYIGLDIGAVTTCSILTADDIQDLVLRRPEDLANIITGDDIIAAEWTGARAQPWAEIATQHGALFYIYHPRNSWGDRRHIGERRKTDFTDARTIAKLLRQYHEAPYFDERTFTPYLTMRPIYQIRKALRIARSLDRHADNIERTYQLTDLDPRPLTDALRTTSRLAWHNLAQLVAQNPHTRPIAAAILQLHPTAQASALALAALLAPLSRFPSLAHLEAYLGLHPEAAQSGKRTRYAKHREGCREARTALLMLSKFPTLTGDLRPYYDRQRSRGKTHRQALLKCARVKLRQIWQILTTTGATASFKPPPPPRQTATNQQRFLQLVEQGYTDAQACRIMGIKAPTVSKWKARSTRFLNAYVEARIKAKENGNAQT